MSLDVANQIMDSGEHTATLIRGQHAAAQRSLTALESTQKTWDEVHDTMESISALGEIKQIGDTYSRYKATPGGVTDFLGQELGKTKAAGQAAGEAVAASGRSALAKGAAAGEALGTAAGTAAGKVGSAATGAVDAVRGVLSGPARPAASMSNVWATLEAHQAQVHPPPAPAAAPAAETAETAAAPAATTAEDVEKTLGGTLKSAAGVSMKYLGAIPGVIDAAEDIFHGGMQGTKTEKAANGLTVAGTILDFIPGLEWAGALTSGVAAGMSIASEKSKQDDEASANEKTDQANHAPTPQVQSWSHMGLVSSLASDSMHTIAGSGHF